MTFREPVLGLLSPDFVYVYMNRIETNYPVCHLYHYYNISALWFVFSLSLNICFFMTENIHCLLVHQRRRVKYSRAFCNVYFFCAVY